MKRAAWTMSTLASVGMALCGLAARAGTDTANDGPAGESFRRFTHDGAWCWFADPRAVHHSGPPAHTYVGWVNSQGDIVVGALDLTTQAIDTVILQRKFERDDHAAPALVVLPDGRLRVFYSKHADTVMRTRITERAMDISAWEPEQTLALNNPAELKPEHPNAVCYPNPVMRADGTLLLFWRGTNGRPCFAVSTDGGATFGLGRIVFQAPQADAHNRPYLKVASRDGQIVHLAFTTGHPRDEETNSVFYCSFDGQVFRRADGSVIGSVDTLPIDPAACDVVHDGPATGVRAWLWDIAADAVGRPAIAYTRLPAETRHVYYYACWDGAGWRQTPVTDAGAWFPRSARAGVEREPHYSAGIVLDHADPRRLYLARPRQGVFELERWELSAQNGQWQHAALTAGSQYDNVRPVAIRQAPADGPRVLWMCVDRSYEHYTQYACSLRMDRPEPPRTTNALDPDTIVRTMERVGRWQLANPAVHPAWDWTHGAFYAGLMALVRTTADPAFERAALEIGRAAEWKPGPRKYFADDHCVGQMYIELYLRHRDEAMLAPIRAALDDFAAQPADEPLDWRNEVHLREWAWCDALFMGPPTLALLYEATRDARYLRELDRRWWKTTDFLYDPGEHLYFRDGRFIAKRESNGQKVFWSRGNGWVLAGLARVLQHLPAEHPTRPRYEQLFRKMSARIAALQQADGLWRASLLNPAGYPYTETSGSGFYCFALAWGVNAGLLEQQQYRPVVERAWSALVRCVDSNGMLEWVQPVGDDPRRVRAAHTDVYGVGALLLAGEQVRRLVQESP